MSVEPSGGERERSAAAGTGRRRHSRGTPEVAAGIQQAGDEVEDPLWTMPLHQPYNKLIESPIADINNAGKGSFAGCITAALFLEHFVEPEIPWVHIDTFAWNQANRPGRPEGGEALSLRAVFTHLEQRFREAGN